MNLRFLNIKDYLRRNFVLSKINLSTTIWQNFVRAKENDLRKLTQFRYHSKSNEQFQISFCVSGISQLYYSNEKIKDSEPCQFLFLIELNEETKEISKMIPVEYYSHKKLKGTVRL